MSYNSPTIAQLVEGIQTMQTAEQIAYIQRMAGYRLHLPELRNALFDRLTELLQNSQPQPQAGNHIMQDGKTYDLSQWATFSQYAERYGLKSTNTISNWINRGIVPADCLVELHHLNSMKLIRCQPYKVPP